MPARPLSAPPAEGDPVRRGPAGLALAGTALRLDPERPAELAFVSGALPGRRLGGHRRILATADVLAVSGIEAGPRALPLSFARPFDLGGLQLEALPSGHVRGGAQLRILTPAGVEVCYAPGICRTPGRTVPAAAVVPCDLLVLGSPFAEPPGPLPTRQAALSEVLAFVARTLGAGATPVLRAASPGAPAELLALLADHDLPARLHRRLRRRLAAAGLLPRGTGSFPGPVAPGETVILPADVEAPAGATVLTVGPGGDVPYADHADDAGLVAHALATGAHRVLTFGPGAGRLADRLAEAGVDAAPLAPAEQLGLL